ncbi:MAG: carboxypeptidase regulatory-like domain-containing protein, partial [Candidatus Acidiferrales bacterium]
MNRTLGLCVGALLVVAFLFASLPAWSQNAGSLQGQVTDPSGAAVAKADVTATDVADGTTRSVQTDSAGSYSFGQLRPGTYKVEVTKEGFRTAVQGQVNVLVSTPTRLDFHLQIGAVNQTVLVVSEAPALNTSDATVGNPFDEQQIKSLPFLARNVVNLLTLQPGVVFTGMSDTDLLSMGTMQSLDLREGSVDGVRSNQTNVTVDGVDSNDWQNQSPFTSALPVTLDSVEEFRVTTTNANATDGLVGGPQVALVTKGGSNNFHGNVRWYYRTSGTAANQFFNNQAGVPRPKLQRNIPGASLGGPIKKDRAFFFLDTEERREISSEPVTPRQVPTDALRDGVLVYQCATASQCPGMKVQGLTAAHVVPAGAFGLTPAQFKSLDPAGLGVNPAMISVLSLYPHGNSPAQG